MKAEDLYAKVTNDLIARIDAGAGTWEMPWRSLSGTPPMSATSGKPYRGINWWILSMEQMDRGYATPWWGTFKGWLGQRNERQPDACVRKGETGTHIFLWKQTPPSAKARAADPEAKPYLLAKTFTVFNRDQVDGLPELPPPREIPQHERWETADGYFRTIGAHVRDGGGRAFYAPVQDFIGMPAMDTFYERDYYYTTLAHEHVHWTGHESRLNRDIRNRFGDEAYAAEELIAEIGAAFWGAQMGLEPAIRQDHASYLSHWLTILRGDSKAIVTAASKAQAALDHLNKLAEWTPTEATVLALAN